MWQWLKPWVAEVLAVVPSDDYLGWESMGLLLLGASVLRESCVEGLGTSWIFALGKLYTVNGIGVSLAVSHFVDASVGFFIEV